MSRFLLACCTVGILTLLPVRPAVAHPGHDRDSNEHTHPIVIAQNQSAPTTTPAKSSPGVSGEGELKFKLLYKGDHLPAEAVAVLTKAHGGFAYDKRPGKGEVYFGLPGAGIIKISSDLSSTSLLPTAPEMKDTNLHNAGIWYGDDGASYLIFPGNDVARVFTTTLDGALVNTLDAPAADYKFDSPTVNTYFSSGGKFVPTDVVELGGMYYITTGYSNLDFVLTAKVGAAQPLTVAWNSFAFGGKGKGPGEFGTGHGITVTPDNALISVADRPNSEIDLFTPDGKYQSTVSLPAGSLPCDTFYSEGYVTVGCLEGPDKAKGAPIYLLKDDKIVSTVMPKEDLGLENFAHIHNAIMIKVKGKLYIIAQAWNPGDFAVLEQVK